MIRRRVDRQAAYSALSSLLEDHERSEWYKANWPAGVKAIADPIADAEATTRDNLKRRLVEHQQITPLLRAHRMTLDPSGEGAYRAPSDGTSVGGLRGAALLRALDEVWRTYRAMLFFHAASIPDAVRESGLDPAFGGTDSGKAATTSLPGKKAANVAASRNRVFVTRKWSEAKSYQGSGGEIMRVLISVDQQAELRVDPDSQFGLYLEGRGRGVHPNIIPITRLGAVDRAGRALGPQTYAMLTAAIIDPEIRDALPDLCKFLTDAGMFDPVAQDELVDLTQPPFAPAPMADEEIVAELIRRGYASAGDAPELLAGLHTPMEWKGPGKEVQAEDDDGSGGS